MTTQSQIIAQSPVFLEVLNLARRVAPCSANVLITGETGTGKEILARFIHEQSPRAGGAFVPINCSAIPEQLMEAELFGYAKGSFTGAIQSRPGLFEEAHGGTLFLDEIGDLDLSLQAKLLRVLQERKLKRVGENSYRSLNIRILAATHNNLEEQVRLKKFREDLFFRLNVVVLNIPPLRQRPEDILPLAHYFLTKFVRLNQTPPKYLSPEVSQYLLGQTWVGNVRALENSIERAVILSQGSRILIQDIAGSWPTSSQVEEVFANLLQQRGRLLSLDEFCREYIDFAMRTNNGLREKTARDLGIDRKTLYRKINSRI